MKFNEIEDLSKDITEILEKNNFIDMTDVQQQTYKHIISNRDVCVCSGTGTGKTLSYLVPLINKLKSDIKNVQIIILVPTQELAVQVNNVSKMLLGYDNCPFSSQFVIGDGNIKYQIDNLKSKPAVLVGTPSRILQLINMRKLKVHEVSTLVIDEADKMLTKTFYNDLLAIRKALMKYTQVLFFSASIDKRTRSSANVLMFKPIYIDINANKNNKQLIPNTIKHQYIISDRRERIETLRKIIKAIKPERAIIFVNSKYDLEESIQKLLYHNYNIGSIAGNVDKVTKRNTLDNFKSGKLNLLIATDIAARGLQIDNIDTVINVNIPEETNEYLHRAGRCGRNGNQGLCISIVTDNEITKIKKLQKAFNITINERRLYQGKLVAK
ncbi:MAG: DEAD/DEAH box helicase [Lachnospira sp.]